MFNAYCTVYDESISTCFRWQLSLNSWSSYTSRHHEIYDSVWQYPCQIPENVVSLPCVWAIIFTRYHRSPETVPRTGSDHEFGATPLLPKCYVQWRQLLGMVTYISQKKWWCKLHSELSYLPYFISPKALQWRHNKHPGVSDHRWHDCLFNRLFRLTSKKTSKPALLALCEGNPLVIIGYPSQSASNWETLSIWWRHHARPINSPRPSWVEGIEVFVWSSVG